NSVAVRILVAVASHRAGRLSNEQARERLQVDVTKSIPTVEALNRLFESDNDVERNAREITPLLERASTLNEIAGQYLLALRDAEAALAINPKSTQARATKVSTLAKLGNIESAVAEFRKLEPSKPPRDLLAQVLNDLAEAALNASQFELALEFAERSIRTLPTAYAYKQRAAILQRVDRFADAQEDLARAQQLETEESR
ncbi:MAG TPA: tetratricopeptide repeat protein, partial [Terrimicrobiaceae bacterium]